MIIFSNGRTGTSVYLNGRADFWALMPTLRFKRFLIISLKTREAIGASLRKRVGNSIELPRC
jgi:hypothetical protein